MNYEVNLVVDNYSLREGSLTYSLTGTGTGTIINSSGTVPYNGIENLG